MSSPAGQLPAPSPIFSWKPFVTLIHDKIHGLGNFKRAALLHLLSHLPRPKRIFSSIVPLNRLVFVQQTDMLTQFMTVHLPRHPQSVDQHTTAGHIIKNPDQLYQRTLAGSGTADDCQRVSPAFAVKRNIFQDSFFTIRIAESTWSNTTSSMLSGYQKPSFSLKSYPEYPVSYSSPLRIRFGRNIGTGIHHKIQCRTA